jgi:4-hydroxythreonine-4-phosphate dehydrogenase
MPFPSVCGTPNPENAEALLLGLRMAVNACQKEVFSGLVTAPLQKSTINEGGIAFSGHTEYLAELTATRNPVMLLVGGDLRVALASTHMPLSEVPSYITRERLSETIEVLYQGLQERFRIDEPEIVVCGLNPHAGESGHLGFEDQNVIAPVIDAFRKKQFNIRGPFPADTAFTPAAGHADAVLAMYHDQGLPVLKYASFGSAVNVTLGLPIIRTSVDHGTALDIAGTGVADSGSMQAAIELAAKLASQ